MSGCGDCERYEKENKELKDRISLVEFELRELKALFFKKRKKKNPPKQDPPTPPDR